MFRRFEPISAYLLSRCARRRVRLSDGLAAHDRPSLVILTAEGHEGVVQGRGWLRMSAHWSAVPWMTELTLQLRLAARTTLYARKYKSRCVQLCVLDFGPLPLALSYEGAQNGSTYFIRSGHCLPAS